MTRHLAIGDIHGCYDALTTLVDFVGIESDDVLITLGDYVNRGPDTCAVIEWLRRFDESHYLVPLRGNHEIMMLAVLDGSEIYSQWIASGGNATLRSYQNAESDQPAALTDIPDAHRSFLRNRLLASYESAGHFFVHANAYPDLPLDEQPDYKLYWEKFNDPPRHESGKIMVCGHTSQKSGLPLANANAICIDTWAYGNGWLSCLHAESGLVWQANQQGETRKFFIDEVDALR